MDLINRAMTTERPDVEALAGELGIAVIDRDLHENICAWMVPAPPDGRWTMVRNARHNAARLRFTTAHMIGHFYFHRELMGDVGCNDGIDYAQVDGVPGHNPRLLDRHDQQATRFAVRLLAPDAIVGRLLAQELNVFQIADRLGIPVRMAKIRIDALRPRR